MPRSRRRSASPLSPGLSRALRGIRSDRRRGATELAGRTLRAIEDDVRRSTRTGTSIPRGWYLALAHALAGTQPGMALFRRWSGELRAIARVDATTHRERSLRGWISRERQGLRGEPERVARVARRRVPARARILTLSRSETVRRTLTSLPPDRSPSEVLVLESRPGGEGRAMARELRKGGVRAQWIPDRAAARAVRSVDLVLIGADGVYRDGSVVHKVGTRRLAEAAVRAGVPVVVLAGRSKWVPELHPSARLPALFDRTPASLITEWWTEPGPGPGGPPGAPPVRQGHERPRRRGGRIRSA